MLVDGFLFVVPNLFQPRCLVAHICALVPHFCGFINNNYSQLYSAYRNLEQTLTRCSSLSPLAVLPLSALSIKSHCYPVHKPSTHRILFQLSLSSVPRRFTIIKIIINRAMSHKILNRYDQAQIASTFAELTDAYFRKNSYQPLNRMLRYKMFIVIGTIIGVFLSQFFKNHLRESSYMLLFLVIFLIAMAVISNRFEIQNGVLVGEYEYNGAIVKYELTYVPNSAKCAIAEVKDDYRRQRQFNYNEFMDESGEILELQFADLLKSFTRGVGSLVREDN